MLFAMTVFLMSIYFGHLILTAEELSTQKTEMAHLILGFLFGLSNSAVGYYFSSSKSSREKTEMMKDIILPADVGQISKIREYEADKKAERKKKAKEDEKWENSPTTNG